MGLRDLIVKCLELAKHPMRKYMGGRNSLWKIWIPLSIGIACVIVGISLEGMLPVGVPPLSTLEYAFSQSVFANKIAPYRFNVLATQLLFFSLGLHYLQSFAIFLGLSCAVAWAANRDPVAIFGVVGAFGDSLTWACQIGWGCEMIGLGMLTYACWGSPAYGLDQANIYFIIYGVQLIMKNLMLGVCGLYVVVIRIAAFLCYKDVDNTPDVPSMSNHGDLPMSKINSHGQTD